MWVDCENYLKERKVCDQLNQDCSENLFQDQVQQVKTEAQIMCSSRWWFAKYKIYYKYSQIYLLEFEKHHDITHYEVYDICKKGTYQWVINYYNRHIPA